MGIKPVLPINLQTSELCCFYWSGPSCSKLTTSLVNVSLKFQTSISQIRQCFLLKNCFSLFSAKNISVFGYKVVKHLTSWPLNVLVKLTMLWTTGSCSLFSKPQGRDSTALVFPQITASFLLFFLIIINLYISFNYSLKYRCIFVIWFLCMFHMKFFIIVLILPPFITSIIIIIIIIIIIVCNIFQRSDLNGQSSGLQPGCFPAAHTHSSLKPDSCISRNSSPQIRKSISASSPCRHLKITKWTRNSRPCELARACGWLLFIRVSPSLYSRTSMARTP